jgi:hypothetical protein
LINCLPTSFIAVADFTANFGLGTKFYCRAFGYVEETDYLFVYDVFHAFVDVGGDG